MKSLVTAFSFFSKERKCKLPKERKPLFLVNNQVRD